MNIDPAASGAGPHEGSPRSWRGLRRALAFLTPFGGADPPTPESVAWFPLAGAVIGLILGGCWWVAARAWPAPLAAAVIVGADLGLTGMLHFDGLLDSADGLLSHLPPERRLAVMATPGVGAFAVAVGGAALVMRFAAMSSLRPAIFLVAGLWCASRTLMAAAMRVVPYARRDDGGLATSFLALPGRGAATGAIAAGALGAVALVAVWRPVAGPAAVVAGWLAGSGVVLLGQRKLGGFTGDVLGAAGVVAETAGLLVAAAKW